MKYLYLDTSSNYLYTGIVSNDKLIGEIKLKLDKDLSSFTLPKISELFNNANISANDIDKIVIVTGPGSFTGVRIGVTIAKVMAWSLNKEVITISSLDAMANSIKEKCCVVPFINARRNHVYGAIYDEDRNIILEGQYISFNELLEKVESLNKKYILVSNDTNLTDQKLHSYDPDILAIVNKYKDKKPEIVHLIEPNYLKLTEAEETKKARETCDN
jgi:tRNA threonylcarbamoyladenosine biosynthesis protein TsaB